MLKKKVGDVVEYNKAVYKIQIGKDKLIKPQMKTFKILVGIGTKDQKYFETMTIIAYTPENRASVSKNILRIIHFKIEIS
jgi:hypothetical protein